MLEEGDREDASAKREFPISARTRLQESFVDHYEGVDVGRVARYADCHADWTRNLTA